MTPSQTVKFGEPLCLENGKVLPELEISYHTYGTLNPDHDNVIWICHAFTANSDAVDWWPGMVGPGLTFDTSRYFVVCANILGSCYGTTGPLSINPATGEPYYLDFPMVTIRDMVNAHERLREHLQIKGIHTIVGGSVGGQQSLEWCIMNPTLIKHLLIIATSAVFSPWGIAINESQRMALTADPSFYERKKDAGQNGLAAARSIALLSYRNQNTYNKTQSETDINKYDDFKASSYQQYQGQKLIRRFSAHSYWYLTKALDSHNVGRNRGGIEAALASVKAHTLYVAISSDLLFTPEEVKSHIKYTPGAEYHEIDSLYGHDGFLLENEKLDQAIKSFYKRKSCCHAE